ncbi:unnamed protein product [Lampetra fluviatilis]
MTRNKVPSTTDVKARHASNVSIIIIIIGVVVHPLLANIKRQGASGKHKMRRLQIKRGDRTQIHFRLQSS